MIFIILKTRDFPCTILIRSDIISFFGHNRLSCCSHSNSAPNIYTNTVFCLCFQCHTCHYIPPSYHYCSSKLNSLASQNSLIFLHVHAKTYNTVTPVAVSSVSLPKAAFSLAPLRWALCHFYLPLALNFSYSSFLPSFYLLCLCPPP